MDTSFLSLGQLPICLQQVSFLLFFFLLFSCPILKCIFLSTIFYWFFFLWHFHFLSLYRCPKNHVPGSNDFFSIEFWALELSYITLWFKKIQRKKTLQGFDLGFILLLEALLNLRISILGSRKKKEIKDIV